MGHHAQYRKRGSVPVNMLSVGRPPAPTAADGSDSLQITATGSNDVGGSFTVEKSATGGVPWTQLWSGAWSRTTNVSYDLLALPGYYRATEIGNGQAYVGASSYSNTVHLI